jgi:chaperonin GroES
MNIQPLQDRVLVKPLEQGEAKKGAIIIPDTAKEKPQEGQIMAAGPGRLSDEGKVLAMSVKVGDKVLYGKYSGSEVAVDGAEFLIMRESDILAVLK